MGSYETITVPGKIALSQLSKLREAYESTRKYPVILGGPDDYELIKEYAEFGIDVILNEGLDAREFFIKKKELDPEIYEDEEGEWPEDELLPMGLITHLDVLTQQPLPDVVIGLFQVHSPHEVFAQLRWGAWNDCPTPQEHIAVHRYWESRYGAEVVSITGDVVQCTVARPPQTRMGCMDLAREQFVYCSDIVHQGVQTVANLAASIKNAPVWYFWWD